MTDTDKASQVHGDGDCPICGRPKRLSYEQFSVCSYPHGMIPDQVVDPEHPEGFWTWVKP